MPGPCLLLLHEEGVVGEDGVHVEGVGKGDLLGGVAGPGKDLGAGMQGTDARKASQGEAIELEVEGVDEAGLVRLAVLAALADPADLVRGKEAPGLVEEGRAPDANVNVHVGRGGEGGEVAEEEAEDGDWLVVLDVDDDGEGGAGGRGAQVVEEVGEAREGRGRMVREAHVLHVPEPVALVAGGGVWVGAAALEGAVVVEEEVLVEGVAQVKLNAVCGGLLAGSLDGAQAVFRVLQGVAAVRNDCGHGAGGGGGEAGDDGAGAEDGAEDEDGDHYHYHHHYHYHYHYMDHSNEAPLGVSAGPARPGWDHCGEGIADCGTGRRARATEQRGIGTGTLAGCGGGGGV